MSVECETVATRLASVLDELHGAMGCEDDAHCQVASHVGIRSALVFHRRFTARQDVREIMERLANE